MIPTRNIRRRTTIVRSALPLVFCVAAVYIAAVYVGAVYVGAVRADEAETATETKAREVTVEVARERAKVMHDIYEATLEAMHHHYFHQNRSIVPARAMEDIFATLDARGEARWISVNTKAMGIDHEPADEFEKQAAKEIAAGKSEFEVVENGIYRRAAPIPLAASCVGCHVGFSAQASKTPRFAGLVIKIPVKGN